MTEIYVDADACPLKDEVVRVAERHGLTVHIVSNSGMRPTGHPLVRPVVGAALRAVEDWWIEGDFRADRHACLERLRGVIRALESRGSSPRRG